MSWSELPAFIENYNLGQTVGKGSFSLVKDAIDTNTRKKYAVKIIPKSNMNTAQDLERFEREVRVILTLNHPGIIKLQNFLADDNFFYVIMEFVHGGSLLSKISKPGMISEETAKPIFKQILETIAYIHSNGIAHRDLKLENVLYDSDHGHIKIIDFGFSRFGNPGQLFQTPCGSPAYAAPEIISGQIYDGKASDMWSMGVILFGLVTGDLPWKGTNQVAIYKQIESGQFEMPTDLSSFCVDLIRSLMTLDPKMRLTADEALHHPWLDGVEVSWNENDKIQPAISARSIMNIINTSGSNVALESPRSVLARFGTRVNKAQTLPKPGSLSFGGKSPAPFAHGMMRYAPMTIGKKTEGIPQMGGFKPSGPLKPIQEPE